MYCDIKRSGCILTWDYLYPNTLYPISVFHIGNADIFNFNHPDTEAFCLGYKDYKLDYYKLINSSISNDNDILLNFKMYINNY